MHNKFKIDKFKLTLFKIRNFISYFAVIQLKNAEEYVNFRFFISIKPSTYLKSISYSFIQYINTVSKDHAE